MQRIILLLPGLVSCRSMVERLRELGVKDSHLHVIASSRYELDGIPQGSVWQTPKPNGSNKKSSVTSPKCILKTE